MADVVMPQMGESIVEATLTRWLKKVGDKVERDEVLFEISTDKVDTEIPSPASGTLTEILVEEGATVGVNTVVARIGDAGAAPAPQAQPTAQPAAPPPPPPPQAAPQPQAPPPPPPAPAPQPAAPAAGPYPATPGPAPAAPASDDDQGPLSPLVRKMAREYNIDLAQVKGTGAGGRITKQDVEAYMASQGAQTASQASAPAPAAPPAPAQGGALPRAEAAKTRVEPLSTMRKKIAEHMVNSKRISAHVTTVHKVDMTKIAKLRDRAKGEFQARNGFSLTFLPFVTAAAAQALRDFPLLNASIDGNNVVFHTDINIGIAVAMDEGLGLIVPTIRNADEKNVAGLQHWHLGMQAGPVFADRKYNQTFYGVEGAYATASRPAYAARGGYSGSQFTLGLSRRFPGYWVGAFTRYDDLGGAVFADSPLMPTPLTPSMSRTSLRGLARVSPKNAPVVGRLASRHWSRSWGSSTKVTSMPILSNV